MAEAQQRLVARAEAGWRRNLVELMTTGAMVVGYLVVGKLVVIVGVLRGWYMSPLM
jgi:hypothetical protein